VRTLSSTGHPRRLTGLVAVAAAAMAVAVVGQPASAQAGAASPAGVIVNAGAPGTVDGSYLVVLKPGVAARSVDAAVAGVTGRHGVSTVRHTYRAALSGFAATMTARQAAQLAADPDVAMVEQDGAVRAMAEQISPPWGLDRIDQIGLPLNQVYGNPDDGADNVRAYIVDTGIRTTHGQFGGRATSGFDAVDGGTADDCNGHGTHVAGTVGGSTYGVAKQVRLVGVRVLGCTGAGTISDVVAGIDWVTANHVKPAVAVLSLGGAPSATLDAATTRSIAAGVTYAVAAGGSGTDACNVSPARVPTAVTVGATTRTDTRASISNTGPCVDIFAPGLDIPSAWHTSNTATNTLSGTSMSAAHAGGVAALILQVHPTLSPAQVTANIVTDGSTKVMEGGTLLRTKLLRIWHGPIVGMDSKCVGVGGAGQPAVLSRCDTPYLPLFWHRTGRTLYNPWYGKCLDVVGGGTADRTPVRLYPCNRTPAQEWAWTFGAHELRNYGSQKCLDVPGGNPVEGARLQIFTCNSTAAQVWHLQQD